MRNALRATSFFLVLTAAFPAFAASFCGKVDFRVVRNEDLGNIVFAQDLSENRNPQRSQCGLAKENFPICSACNDEFPESSLSALRPVLGSKEHLNWHANWHKSRMMTEDMGDAMFAKLAQSGFFPTDVTATDFFRDYARGTGSRAGENFFYMHRMMIKMMQFELAMRGLPCVAPWKDVPGSVNDKLWPVPHDHPDAASVQQDQQRLDGLRALFAKFNDEKYLAKVSLNKLGNALEPSLHDGLHEFYRGTQHCSSEAKAQGYCDDLVPVETSPLNKHFWKLHGLIDGLLGHWLDVHGYREIATNCEGRAQCYTWKATWVGRYPSN